MLSKIIDCQYHSIVISVHAVVSLIYRDTKLTRDPPKWRFQPGWLGDPSFVDFLGEQIDIYFFKQIYLKPLLGFVGRHLKLFYRDKSLVFVVPKIKNLNKN